jgi:acyl-CoA thioesterase
VTALSARLEQEGKPCILALGAYGYERAGKIDYSTPAPVVPAPDETPESDTGIWSRVFPGQLDYRSCLGPPLFSGADESLVGGWMRLSDGAEVDEAVLALFADAWPISLWPRLSEPNPSPTMDMTFHFRNHIPPGTSWVLTRASSTTSAHGFFEEDAELWAPDGTLLAQTRQLALIRSAQQR